MRKITKFPKTRKEYHRCHVKMWQWIVDNFEKEMCKFKNKEVGSAGCFVRNLKKKAIKNCFKFKNYIIEYCFACDWFMNTDNFHCSNNCLLKSKKACLDGVWGKFFEAILKRDNKKALYYAKKIRDKELNPNYKRNK